ncbi:MAG: amino acid permease, partial [Chloroflexi bacterium]|nr:amino acid permease [Chloroflexota bacterium]
ATAAAARLLYGMGRDNLLPKPVFGAINKRFQTPHWNIAIVTALIFIIAATLNVNTIVNYINFGALSGFIMLNITVIWIYIVKKTGVEINIRRAQSGLYHLRYLIVPLIGLGVLAWVFLSLANDAKIFGGFFLLVGIIYLAARTRLFRELPPELEV